MSAPLITLSQPRVNARASYTDAEGSSLHRGRSANAFAGPGAEFSAAMPRAQIQEVGYE